jgi:AcrR family transcriptional regulator
MVDERFTVPGTPAWWANRRPPGTVRRRGRPPLSFERIVAGASEIVDEIGSDAFSMRLLARRLDTSTATLYRHVAGKDELMVYVVEHFLRDMRLEHEVAAGSSEDWRDVVRDAMLGFYRALSAHPNLIPLLVTQVPVGPNGLASRERAIAMLVGFGFPATLAARGYSTLVRYTVGFAVQQHAPRALTREDATALGDYFRQLDRDAYPQTIAAAESLTAVAPEDGFAEGLHFILSGIDKARTAPG